MKTETQCPVCRSENIYFDGNLWICPECSHEWNSTEESAEEELADGALAGTSVIRDSNGNELKDGDTVTVIKDLNIKG